MSFALLMSCVANLKHTIRRFVCYSLTILFFLCAGPAAADSAGSSGTVAVDITIGDQTDDPTKEFPDWEDDEVAHIRIDLDPTNVTKDVDIVVLVLAERSRLWLETRGTVDTVGHLIDDQGVDIASDDDSGEGSNFRIEITVDAGRYLLGIGRASGSLGAYRLKASASPIP